MREQDVLAGGWVHTKSQGDIMRALRDVMKKKPGDWRGAGVMAKWEDQVGRLVRLATADNGTGPKLHE